MKKNDINKDHRDGLDPTVEQKFMLNLQWSMIFFCFNFINDLIAKENDIQDKNQIKIEFIKKWKHFAQNNIARQDLEIINNILNSPKNTFYAALKNDDEIMESTEIYQEKYNSILQKIEKFFLDTLKSPDDYIAGIDDDEENDDDE